MRWRRWWSWVRREYGYLLLRVLQKRRDQKIEDALLVQEWASAVTSGDRDRASLLVAESWGQDEFLKATAGGGSAPLPEPLFPSMIRAGDKNATEGTK